MHVQGILTSATAGRPERVPCPVNMAFSSEPLRHRTRTSCQVSYFVGQSRKDSSQTALKAIAGAKAHQNRVEKKKTRALVS